MLGAGRSASQDGVNVWSVIASEKEHVIGRNRKHSLGDIVCSVEPQESKDQLIYWSPQRYVVVGYDDTPDARRYRVVPLDAQKRRRGDAVWMESWKLDATGEHSGTASVKTYRANEALISRECSCQCCIHESYDPHEWTNHGKWRESELSFVERSKLHDR